MATYVQQYRLAASRDAEMAVAATVAEQIEQKQLRLMDLVVSIGEDVNSSDATVRAKVIEYLGAVLASLDRTFLSRQDISLLVKYLCARIENDRRGVKETAQAIRRLIGMHHFTRQDAPPIVEAIHISISEFPDDYFGQIDVTRLEILDLLHDLQQQHSPTLKGMGDTYVDTLLACAARESRAKNLMVWFGMMHLVLSDWDVSSRVQQCWDRLSMYFPITMNPAALANEKSGVTVEELKQKLRDCMSATSLFAPFSFKLMMDKLRTHTAVAVKKDIFLSMNACVMAYTVADVSDHCDNIWSNLKYEIFSSTETENDLSGISLDVLRSISRKLSSNLALEGLEYSPLNKFLRSVMEECLNQSNKEDHNRQIISAISQESLPSYHLVVDFILPKMFMKYYGTPKEARSERESQLRSFLELMKDRIVIFKDEEALSKFPLEQRTKEAKSFSQFATQLFNIFEDLIENSSLDGKAQQLVLGVQGVITAILMADMSKDTTVRIARRLANAVVNWEATTDYSVFEELVTALEQLAQKDPDMIAEYVLPIFQARIPDDIPADTLRALESSHDQAMALKTFEGLSKVCSHGPLFQKFHDIMFSVLRLSAPSSLAPYRTVQLSSILYNLERRDALYLDKRDAGIDELDHQEYQTLATRLLLESVQFDGPSDLATLQKNELNFTVRADVSDQFLALVGRICGVIAGSERFNGESSWLEWGAGLVRRLLYCVGEEPSPTFVRNGESRSWNRRVFLLATPILASLRREAVLQFDASRLACQVIKAYMDPVPAGSTMNDETSMASRAMLGLISLLLNKWNANKSAGDELPQSMAETYFSTYFSNDITMAQRSADLMTTIAAALLMRMDKAANELHVLLGALSDEQRGGLVAMNFGTLIAPSDILTKKHYAVVRLLYKHSCFNRCVPQLLIGFNTAPVKAVKLNYLIALTGMLAHADAPLVAPFAAQLVAPVMSALDSTRPEIRSSAVKTLATLLQESPGTLQQHARSIVVKALQGATNKATAGEPPADVRAKAVNLVTLMAQCLPSADLQPLRSLVQHQLRAVKDSPYRAVRAAGVRCQMAWFPVVPADMDAD